MGKIQKACQGYTEWKAQNSPKSKTWRHPEQSSLPTLNFGDIGTMNATSTAALIDETDIEREGGRMAAVILRA